MTIFRFRQKASQLVRFWQQQFNSHSLLSLQSLMFIKGILLFLLSIGVFLYITDRVINLETRDWDLDIMLAIQKTHIPLLDILMKTFSNIGGPLVLIGISVGLTVKFGFRRQRIELFGLLLAAIGGALLSLLIKACFNRSRPQIWAMIDDHLNTSSYPSGHVMNGVVIYGFCGYLLARSFPRWRGLIYLGTFLLVLAIGWSRMYVGLHWPTDVLAGYATGFAWLNASIFSFEILKQREEIRRKQV
ncbi:phosphatase PAP2 family protein [Phormidium pseudopriestleyi FRX01]|uniref:Phosphatase PAP2 family protein n=1 Tax=Phormidium pseudopriestleyi FRX01 TaxID=1759528 RepID=A0ABS3FVW6_9CYAN|nr:phosphatase PAP2 family protein [Phormidium pseudopriestleyi]MBO0351129.1 phosphatase PAP2 family protein [Phormidium pseudopriestleyi FRX01]